MTAAAMVVVTAVCVGVGLPIVVALGLVIGFQMGKGEVGATIGFSILGFSAIILLIPVALGLAYLVWGFLLSAFLV